jgi:hypothetical protein
LISPSGSITSNSHSRNSPNLPSPEPMLTRVAGYLPGGSVAGALKQFLEVGPWSPSQMADDDDARLVLEVVGAMRVAEKPFHDKTRRLLADGDEGDLDQRILRK